MTRIELNPDAASLLRELKNLLAYHLASGIESYPATEEMAAVMRLSGKRSEERRPAGLKQQRPQPGARSMQQESVIAARDHRPAALSATLDEIRGEVAICRHCGLSEERIVPVAGHGGDRVRLLVVGDWLTLPEGQMPPTGCVFGIEQDRMLGKMFDAIKLLKKQVFVTNVIKCGIPASCQPKAEHVRACLPFLHRQIALLQPEIILAMGMIATKALLNRREPLSALRGQLHALVVGEDLRIPLIATYHPTFLLQNPEMKKATWLDLQLLARQLGTIP